MISFTIWSMQVDLQTKLQSYWQCLHYCVVWLHPNVLFFCQLLLLDFSFSVLGSFKVIRRWISQTKDLLALTGWCNIYYADERFLIRPQILHCKCLLPSDCLCKMLFCCMSFCPDLLSCWHGRLNVLRSDQSFKQDFLIIKRISSNHHLRGGSESSVYRSWSFHFDFLLRLLGWLNWWNSHAKCLCKDFQWPQKSKARIIWPPTVVDDMSAQVLSVSLSSSDCVFLRFTDSPHFFFIFPIHNHTVILTRH